MRRWSIFGLAALLTLILVGCGAAAEEDRIPAIQEKYAAAAGYSAVAELRLARESEETRYTLRVDAAEEGTSVTVLAPELLAGVTVRLDADALRLEYDGLVLDAGGTIDSLCAVNCLPLTLRAVAEGYVVEENEETFDDIQHALRVCFESEVSGETLRYTVWFSTDDLPLYAEIAKNEEIAIYMEFTNFTFCDIMSADESDADS